MIIPFRIKIDDDYNEEIEFIFRATKKGYYSVLLTYDPITETYMKTKCECWDYKMGLKKDENYQCKHIKEAIEVLENHKKELNKGELQ